MSTCEQCGVTFTKSQYSQHQKRKTPCVKPSPVTVDTAGLEELKAYYDQTLNLDKTTYLSSNDETTPIDCIQEMISKLPPDLWSKPDLAILDPCCGNGNFGIPLYFELLKHHDKRIILEQILVLNDVNEARLAQVRNVFCGDTYALQVTNHDFLAYQTPKRYDLIVANPPYAKLLENGKRASKNHNLIKLFLDKALSLLKPNGYLLFITPDNWMSFADRNLLIEMLTSLQIIHLDIHSAKKYFKKIGSSFTWYVIQNCPFYKDMTVSGVWKKKEYTGTVVSGPRRYIPLLYTQQVHTILSKTIDTDLPKFDIQTSSDLHRYTKKQYIQDTMDEVYRYRLIHTPSQTVYASRPHKFQEGYKVFLSTTDKYKVFVDQCGMTQSIVFLLCKSEEEAKTYKKILEHPLYVFLNNICRWGNFNNIRILQRFPIPTGKDIYDAFHITEEETRFIEKNL